MSYSQECGKYIYAFAPGTIVSHLQLGMGELGIGFNVMKILVVPTLYSQGIRVIWFWTM
jgi:hypothetical protein